MTDVTVTLSKDSKFFVTVNLSVVRSAELHLKSRLAETSERLTLPDGSAVPSIAAEAACFSGGFFGLRKIGDMNYAITIQEAFGALETGHLAICAIAASIGVKYAAGHKEAMRGELLKGWRLVECTERSAL